MSTLCVGYDWKTGQCNGALYEETRAHLERNSPNVCRNEDASGKIHGGIYAHVVSSTICLLVPYDVRDKETKVDKSVRAATL
jgi:hypothetical protein